MKNILLILVGGTICTALNKNNYLAVSDEAGSLLIENYLHSDSQYIKSVNFDATENLQILSENMTVDKWNQIIEVFRNYLQKNKYDGVVVAHGTDTLAYSSAIFSMLLSGLDIPVFFVSANENLKSERTNGNNNFRCAVECICRGISPNIYVAYKNLTDGKMYLHLASRLRQCENYSEDFYSEGMIDLSGITESNYKVYFNVINEKFPQEKKHKVIDISGDWKLDDCILNIKPYVGLNYSCFQYDEFSAVLHGTFHSGTACAEKTESNPAYGKNSILFMLDKCFSLDTPIDVYFSPSLLQTGTYETVSIIGNHSVNGKKINFLYGYTNEMAYAKLVIAYSLFGDLKKRTEFINNEYNFEFAVSKV